LPIIGPTATVRNRRDPDEIRKVAVVNDKRKSFHSVEPKCCISIASANARIGTDAKQGNGHFVVKFVPDAVLLLIVPILSFGQLCESVRINGEGLHEGFSYFRRS